MINPIFTDRPQTIEDIQARTGQDFDTILRAVRNALAARLVTCRLIGADMTPTFRKNEPDGNP